VDENQPSPTASSPQPEGAETDLGSQMKQGISRAIARDRVAHEPEPNPRNGLAQGFKATGQPRPGKENKTPLAAATARVKAMERAANAPRDEPVARKTRADGTLERTTQSTPEAQPTYTGVDTTERTLDRTAGVTEREPLNPMQG
jgi:hypothetical protein